MTALEVRDLSYAYADGTPALRNMSLQADEGECIGVVGPNGAGKSTLMLHMNGVLPEDPPDSPTVFVHGKGVTATTLHEIHREVGLLFQECERRAGVACDVALIGLIEAGEESQERGLSGAVRSDKAQALAGANLKTQIVKQRLGSELPSKVGGGDEQHRHGSRANGI